MQKYNRKKKLCTKKGWQDIKGHGILMKKFHIKQSGDYFENLIIGFSLVNFVTKQSLLPIYILICNLIGNLAKLPINIQFIRIEWKESI